MANAAERSAKGGLVHDESQTEGKHGHHILRRLLASALRFLKYPLTTPPTYTSSQRPVLKRPPSLSQRNKEILTNIQVSRLRTDQQVR